MQGKRSTGWLFIMIAACLVAVLLTDRLEAQELQDRKRQSDAITDEESALHGVEEGLDEADDELSQALEFDYGGYARFTYLNFTDGEDKHVRREWDTRLWTNMVYKNMHQLYVRVQGNYKDYNEGTQYYYEKENDWSIPRLDVGYYQADISRIFGLDESFGSLRVKAGRDYFTIGEGLVLDRRGDGAQFSYTVGDCTLTGFAMQSIVSEDALDRSHPDFGHDRRFFTGFEAGHTFTREAEMFVYGVWQRFKNKKSYSWASERWGNHEFFYGGGLKGEVGSGFNYLTEYARQKGRRFTESDPERSRVEADAYNLKAEYTFRSAGWQPKLTAQHVYGSGDSDAGNTLDTLGGNLTGTDYKAFNNYGYINTGLVFFPRIANIQVYHLGATVKPFRFEDEGIDLELGVGGYHYERPKRSGGVSDRFVATGKSFLGREVDLFAIIRPFSDVTIMAQYGIFNPSNAFIDDSKRRYLSIATIIYF